MRQRAFTLIELLVYVGILTIVLGIIFFFMANIIINERSIGDRVRMIDEADFAMRQVLDQARGAKNIDISTDFVEAGGYVLVLGKTDSTVNINIADKTLVMAEIKGGISTTRVLTSPRVEVSTFSIACTKTGVTCDYKSVRITLSIKNTATQEIMTLTTSATPRGY